MPLVYDVGLLNGDDTDYYLTKGYDVVAVEANPEFCRAAEERFRPFVESGRLKVINRAVAAREGVIDFYIHKTMPGLSTILAPEEPADWEKISVPCAPRATMIERPDEIAFMKIDIERADLLALDSLHAASLAPRHLSCEAHSVEILAKMILMGYSKFRLLHGKSVHKRFAAHKIRLLDGGVMKRKFSIDSSGPFGDDLPGDWYNADQIMYLWAGRSLLYGKGWFDLHAIKD